VFNNTPSERYILTLLAALMEQGGGKGKEEIKEMSVEFQWIFQLILK
jgi:hypothetical protein